MNKFKKAKSLLYYACILILYVLLTTLFYYINIYDVLNKAMFIIFITFIFGIFLINGLYFISIIFTKENEFNIFNNYIYENKFIKCLFLTLKYTGFFNFLGFVTFSIIFYEKIDIYLYFMVIFILIIMLFMLTLVEYIFLTIISNRFAKNILDEKNKLQIENNKKDTKID